MWFQMYFDNSVSVLYFSFLKDFWWLLNLCFNVRLVILIYVLVSSDVLTWLGRLLQMSGIHLVVGILLFYCSCSLVCDWYFVILYG